MDWRHRLTLTALLLALCGPAAAAARAPIGDVMAGEFALQQGDLGTAARHYVLAARMGYNGPYVAGLVTLSTLLGMVSLPFALGVLN